MEKGIRSREELLIFAKDQKDEGKKDITEFIVNRGSKVVAEVVNTTWGMECAEQKRLVGRSQECSCYTRLGKVIASRAVTDFGYN